MECAKDMMRESLPIKCLEAVILATYPFNAVVVRLYRYSLLCINYPLEHRTIAFNILHNFQFAK